MTFLRLIRRSLRNKLPKLGPEGSHYHTSIQQHHRHGLDQRKSLLIPTSSTLCINRRHFYNTTPAANQHDEEALSLESPENSINNVIQTDYKDRWENATSIIKIGNRTADEIWEEYTQLLEDPTTELTEFDYITVCIALKMDKASATSVKRIQTLLRQVHGRGDMPEVFVRCCNMLIHVYLEHLDLSSARLVFDGLLRSKYELTSVTVNTLLNGIAQLGTAKDALALYQSLSRQGLFPNSLRTYQALIRVLGMDFGDVDTSISIFTKLQENGKKKDDDTTEKSLLTPDISLYDTMLHVYKKWKQPERAWALYSQSIMAEDSDVTPTSGTYYVLLKAMRWMEEGDSKAARIKIIYDDMLRLGLKLTAAHYQAMGWDALEALDALKKDGSQLKVGDYNLLMTSAVKNNKFEDALAMFQDMWKENDYGDGVDDNKQQEPSQRLSPDVVTYGIILDALVKDIEQPVAAIYDIYEEMKQHGVKPDVMVYSSLLQACGRDGDMDRAVGFLEEMQEFKIQPNAYTLNTFMGVLSQKPVKEKHDMYSARALWDHMIDTGVYPDTRTFNQYLSLLSQFVPTMDPNEIKSTLSRIQEDDGGQRQQQRLDDLFDDDKRDDNNILMGGIPMSGTAKYMMNIYRTMRHSNGRTSRPDFVSYSILINTMVGQGQTRQAMKLFRDAQMVKKKFGVNIYNTIMQGLLRDSELHQILHMWQDMKANRVLPDRASYDLVLDACEQLHLAESFTTIMQQRELDSGRLAQMDRAREIRWSRSKSIKAEQQQTLDYVEGRLHGRST